MLHLPHRLFKIILAALFVTSSTGLLSQKPYFSKIRFSLPTEEPVFHEIVQDNDGYLWLGSEDGLFRFDGINFIKFHPADDTLSFQVTALATDPSNTLWIGCGDGSIHYLHHGKMTSFSPEEGTSSTAISDILFNEEGIMWWATQGEGVYYYNGTRVFNIDRDNGLGDDYVYKLETDRDGIVYAATDNGITRLTLKGDQKKVERPEINSQLPDIIVRTIKRDASGKLWLGFHDAGMAYIPEEGAHLIVPEAFLDWSFGPVDHIAFAGNSLWTGSNREGVIQIGQGKNITAWQQDDRGNPFGRVHQLFQDREGNIWILSSNGLFRSTGNRVQYMKEADDRPLTNIHALMEDSRGYLWYSNDEGIFRMDLSRNEVQGYLNHLHNKSIKFMCIDEDRHGFIWTGTFDHGLFRIDPFSGEYLQVTEQQGLVNNNVLSISSHHDTLWMATLGGASSLVLQGNKLRSPYQITSFNQENGLVNTFIYDVYEDDRNRIWFATDGDGIGVMEEGRFTFMDESSGLGDDVIYSISGDTFGNIWFSTASDGIYRYYGKAFQHFGTEAGIRSLGISSLEISGNEIIIVHELGIDILHMPSMFISHYGAESGLAEMRPELNAIHKSIEGEIWIGTSNGIVRYEPALPGILFKPKTVIEKVMVFLKEVPMENGLSLKSNQNHIGFSYAGLWLSNPEKVLFKVFLEGYDLDWKTTFDKTALYSNLPPGDYTFYVRSALDNSFNQASEVSFPFHINNPIWLNPWFILFILTIIAVIIYLVVKYREKRLRMTEEQKKEKVEFEFQMLKNQINPHFLFNSFSTLMSLIEEDRDNALEYTEKLSDFFRKILQLKEGDIIPLSEELELIRDYLFIQGKRYGDLIRFDVALEEGLLKTAIPPMTLQMLMENAVKHNIISKDKPLYIKLYAEKGYLVLENTYQPKRHTETSTGIGLENISRRYRLLTDKEIRIEQQDNIFTVWLPLI